MNLEYGERYETLRAEVREFLRGWPLSGAEAKLPRLFVEPYQMAGKSRKIEGPESSDGNIHDSSSSCFLWRLCDVN